MPLQGMAKDKANGGATPPKPIYTPDPGYTEAARRDRVQGTAVVHLNLATDRTTHDIKAVEAVTKWKFQPAMKDGAPVATSITLEVAFRLR